MAEALSIARSELILGGQKSGKSRRAELLARQWLAQTGDRRAVLIATAQPLDDEMRQRIARHQQDRAERVPGLQNVEEPLALAQAVAAHGGPKTLLIVDCLTLWLTNLLMPPDDEDDGGDHPPMQAIRQAIDTGPHINALLQAIRTADGPVVLVGNEIGLGVIPLGRDTRAFVDALGILNQLVAGVSERVTLMAAGLPLTLKGRP